MPLESKDKSLFEILVCLDDENLELRVSNLCNAAGYSVNRSCYNFLHGISADEFEDTPLIITSWKTISGMSGEEIKNCLNSTSTQVLYLGHANEIKSVESLWIVSPTASDEEILHFVAKACIMHELTKENAKYKSILNSGTTFKDFITTSPRMKEVYDLIQRVAPLAGSILLTGESGTGKSLLARYVHSLSLNKSGAFISLSCATFPRDLIESELFGNEKGAFTGSISARAGAVELADNGTLFLDEIGDLPIDLQPKLLTFLQDKITKRLGGTKSKKVSVRVISATNLSLESMIGEKRFRSDLFYRINTFHIHLPSLRERKDDIPILADNILRRINQERNNRTSKLSNSCYELLSRYTWPGNIRELENVLEQATAYSKNSVISDAELREVINAKSDDGYSATNNIVAKEKLETFEGTLAEIEKRVILDRLALCKNNKAQTARSLGISLKTLYNKLK